MRATGGIRDAPVVYGNAQERGIGRAPGMDQVDSRAAAVNTNNGEYRSVNCVLGFVERWLREQLGRPPPRVRVRASAFLSFYISSCPRQLFFFFFLHSLAARNSNASRCISRRLRTRPFARRPTHTRCNAMRLRGVSETVNLNFNNQSLVIYRSIWSFHPRVSSKCWGKKWIFENFYENSNISLRT